MKYNRSIKNITNTNLKKKIEFPQKIFISDISNTDQYKNTLRILHQNAINLEGILLNVSTVKYRFEKIAKILSILMYITTVINGKHYHYKFYRSVYWNNILIFYWNTTQTIIIDDASALLPGIFRKRHFCYSKINLKRINLIKRVANLIPLQNGNLRAVILHLFFFFF